MISIIREHNLLTLALFAALCLYLFLPLQLQAPEPYNYATAIEGYFRNSAGFELAQGQKLPDFGRYHPNHPLGHVLAGWAFDWLKIPALSWMRFVNILGALFAGFFLYQIALQFRLAKSLSTLTVCLFLATNCGLFTVFSGEWHIPALALSLAAILQFLDYADKGTVRHLYYGSILITLAACYHLVVIFFLVPIGGVLVFVRPIKKHWREFLIAGLMILLFLAIVYVVIPVVLFHFGSSEEFFRTFLMYKYLSRAHYDGFEWIQMAARTAFHSFIYIPARLKGTDIFVAIFFTALVLAFWRFHKSVRERPKKALILLLVAWWPILYWVIGLRAESLLGWLFALPLTCLIIVKALSDLSRHGIYVCAGLTLLVLSWNFTITYLPNSLSKRENVFYFNLPPGTPSTTPIAFVIGEPLLIMGEIWHAGSELGYRNQMHFMPCCGEKNYLSHLKHWALQNPGFVLISDGRKETLESLIRTQGLHYRIWSDRQGEWPSPLIQTTLYIQHQAPNFYPKRLTIWVPENGIGLP